MGNDHEKDVWDIDQIAKKKTNFIPKNESDGKK